MPARLTDEEKELLGKFGFLGQEEEVIHKKLGISLNLAEFKRLGDRAQKEAYIKEILRNQCRLR